MMSALVWSGWTSNNEPVVEVPDVVVVTGKVGSPVEVVKDGKHFFHHVHARVANQLASLTHGAFPEVVKLCVQPQVLVLPIGGFLRLRLFRIGLGALLLGGRFWGGLVLGCGLFFLHGVRRCAWKVKPRATTTNADRVSGNVTGHDGLTGLVSETR